MEGFLWYCLAGLVTMIITTIYFKVTDPFDYDEKFLTGILAASSFLLWWLAIPVGVIAGLVWLVMRGVDWAVEAIRLAKREREIAAQEAAVQKRLAELKEQAKSKMDETKFTRSEETNWKPKPRKVY